MLEGSISYQIICFIECEINQLEIGKYKQSYFNSSDKVTCLVDLK